MRLRVGFNVSAPLLYGLSWVLFGVAALMAVVGIAALLGLITLPVAPVTDLTGAAICAALALLCRSLAQRFDHAI